MPLSYKDLVKPELLSQPVYQPGKPIEDVARELGLDPAGILKLASNENPLGASPLAKAAAKAAIDKVHLYPDGGCFKLKRALADKFALGSDQFILGNGSNEVLELVGHAFISPGDEAVMGKGAFIVYKLVTLLFGGKPVEVAMPDCKHDLAAMAAAITPRTKLVFLPSPDNPSGSANSAEEIEAFANALPDHVLFVFDEAYAEYQDKAPDLRPLIAKGKKILCVRTFSKIYGLAGLRLGYGYGEAELVNLINQAREPFNVNAVAQAAGIAALGDDEWVRLCRAENAASRSQLVKGFSDLGLKTIPSAANFVTVDVGDCQAAFQALQADGVITRPLGPYGMPQWLRVTAGLPAENERALGALKRFLSR